MNMVVKVWLTLVLMILGVYGAYTGYRVYQARAASQEAVRATESLPKTPVASLEKTTLTHTDGKPFALKQFKGQVWVASFFFSSCPGSCTQLNRTIAGLQDELAEKGVKIASISVDPATDTPRKLLEYSKIHEANPENWFFLTGDFKVVESLGTDIFKVTVGPKMHADRLVLIDREGQVRGSYNALDALQLKRFNEKVDEVLAEGTVESVSAVEIPTADDGDADTDDTEAAAADLDEAVEPIVVETKGAL